MRLISHSGSTICADTLVQRWHENKMTHICVAVFPFQRTSAFHELWTTASYEPAGADIASFIGVAKGQGGIRGCYEGKLLLNRLEKLLEAVHLFSLKSQWDKLQSQNPLQAALKNTSFSVLARCANSWRSRCTRGHFKLQHEAGLQLCPVCSRCFKGTTHQSWHEVRCFLLIYVWGNEIKRWR